MDIGEVVKLSGMRASTLRYYEEKGLIRSTGRKGLRRLYHSSVLDSLAFIALGSEAGFTLDELAKMFSSGKLKIDKNQLREKAMELDKKIKKLQSMKKGLLHAAKCPAPHHTECPTFAKIIRVVKKKQVKKQIKMRA